MGLLDLSAFKVTNNVSNVDGTVQDSMIDAIQAVVNALVDANIDPAAAIAISKLAAGSNGQIIQTVAGVPTWVSGTKTTVSAMSGGPPGSPSDGDIWIATAVDANGARWSFQYNAGSGSSFKWEFIGGTSLFSEVAAQETRTNVAYGALGTAGPSIVIPRSGDYDVTVGAMLGQDGGSSASYMSYDIGGTGAVDADAIFMDGGGGTPVYTSGARKRRKTGLTAVTLTAKYRTTGPGQGEFANRFMEVVPVRIS